MRYLQFKNTNFYLIIYFDYFLFFDSMKTKLNPPVLVKRQFNKTTSFFSLCILYELKLFLTIISEVRFSFYTNLQKKRNDIYAFSGTK